MIAQLHITLRQILKCVTYRCAAYQAFAPNVCSRKQSEHRVQWLQTSRRALANGFPRSPLCLTSHLITTLSTTVPYTSNPGVRAPARALPKTSALQVARNASRPCAHGLRRTRGLHLCCTTGRGQDLAHCQGGLGSRSGKPGLQESRVVLLHGMQRSVGFLLSIWSSSVVRGRM